MNAPSSHQAKTEAAHAPKLLHRAAHTPARDWIRGRVTGRLDWRSDLARTDLPAPIAALITTVVRRSRLWRLERADLARELITHFADALAAGTAEENAVEDFGDTAQAARLIRRAKKRGRHWSYRAFIHTFQGLLAIFLAVCIVYAVLAWRFFSAKPTITRNYTAEYNEQIEQIPEQDRAWEFYVQTYAALERLPDELVNSWPVTAPEHPRYADALAYLESQQDVIALAHRAAALPHLGAPLQDELDPRMVDADNARRPDTPQEYGTPSENPMVIGVLLPELGHMRSLAQLLTFDAHTAAAAGDAARAARDIETMLGIAHHAGDRPVIISRLVQIAIYHLALNTTGQIIDSRPDLFTDEHLRSLAHRIAAHDVTEIGQALQGERWMFHDMVQRVYSDDGNGGGHLTYEGLQTLMMFTSMSDSSAEMIVGPSPLGPITAALVADRASLRQKYDAFMDKLEIRASTPMWEYDTHPRVSDEVELLAASPIDRVRYFPIVVMMPALDRATEVGQRVAQSRDGVLTGIALELYRRSRGSYPDALDQLTPGFLPAVPPDRFTGGPIAYAISDGQPRLWSVGTDRDDDGGTAPTGSRDESGRWLAKEQALARLADPKEAPNFDGDWILWPIPYEPIRSDEP